MIPHVNLTHLKFFCDAAKKMSISEAAKENFVSQSAISQGIMKLEQVLQTKLTTHQRQRFKMTTEGEIVFKQAKLIFKAVRTMQNDLHAAKEEIAGTVRLACTNSIAKAILPDAILQAQKKYPKMNVEFHRGNLSFIRQTLKNDQADLALVLAGQDFESFEQKTVMSGGFKLYSSRKQSAANFDNGVIVDHACNTEVKQLQQLYRKFYDKDLKINMELSGWSMVSCFVERGHGIGLLPEFMVHEKMEIQEVITNIPPISYKMCALYRKEETLSLNCKAFLECVQTNSF